MRVPNPFGHKPKPIPGESGSLDILTRHAELFTLQIPGLGTGPYLYNPLSSCPIHSHHPEAWCDMCREEVARDQLHWHPFILSERGVAPEDIREMGETMINGRKGRLTADRQSTHEGEMAELEGDVEAAPSRAEIEREDAANAEALENMWRTKAEEKRQQREQKRKEHDELPRRLRLGVSKLLAAAISVGLVIFNAATIGTAFELIPGDDDLWKVLLAVGVAAAPLSTAIGLGLWLSTAEHKVRHGDRAGRFALIVGVVGIVGILLIVPFRVAAFSDEVIDPWAFSFLAFIEIALTMAEVALYVCLFDAQVGVALRDQMDELNAEAIGFDELAEIDRANARQALLRAAQIERDAAQKRGTLRREEAIRVEIANAEDGTAGMLRAVVHSATLEGIAAARRLAERKAEQLDELEEAAEKRRRRVPALVLGALVTLGIAATALAGAI